MMKQTSWVIAALMTVAVFVVTASAGADPLRWGSEWPDTDFTKRSIDLGEILSGGPPKDGIPSIDAPEFQQISASEDLAETEPVVGLIVNGEAKAYPLRILIWHEIVNDTIGGVPVVVTYCPLCNSSIVFERRVNDRILDFGTTGKLRNSDLVMFDRQTESWWQQFSGETIVGAMTGTELKVLPSRLESWERFKVRAPEGKVLVPNNEGIRDYGRNPYIGYDSREVPYPLYQGPLPADINPMMRVVVVDNEAWTLPLIREKGPIAKDDVTIQWVSGQNSALDSARIAGGRDVGNVIVQRGTGAGAEDVAHDVTFAFVFRAFNPEGVIHQQ